MKGISRRARTCAVAAVTGVAVLTSAGAAQAQRPASLGEGLPVGQTGMQMFNFSRYITGTPAEQKAKVQRSSRCSSPRASRSWSPTASMA